MNDVCDDDTKQFRPLHGVGTRQLAAEVLKRSAVLGHKSENGNLKVLSMQWDNGGRPTLHIQLYR